MQLYAFLLALGYRVVCVSFHISTRLPCKSTKLTMMDERAHPNLFSLSLVLTLSNCVLIGWEVERKIGDQQRAPSASTSPSVLVEVRHRVLQIIHYITSDDNTVMWMKSPPCFVLLCRPITFLNVSFRSCILHLPNPCSQCHTNAATVPWYCMMFVILSCPRSPDLQSRINFPSR